MTPDPDPMDILRGDVKRALGAGQGHAPDGARIDSALTLVAPRPVPSVVLSLAPKSAHETARLLEAIPASLDDIVARYPVKIELRLDALPSFSERMTAASLVLRLGVPVIFTLRARQEGGQVALAEPERQRFLLGLVAALRTGPPAGSLIDIEASAVANDPEGWGQVIAHAHEKDFHVLLSHHDFGGTPERAEILLPEPQLLDSTPGGPALLWKSATSVRTWTQERALLRAARAGNATKRRAVIMGLDSPVARLLAPFFGQPLTYAAVDEEHATAPGQLPFRDLVHTWARWGVRVDDHALARPGPRRVLLGRPAWHSLSPAIQNAAARELGMDDRYFPLELPTDDGPRRFQETLRDLPTLGIDAGNVTVPFKTDLALAADRLEGPAEGLGAANTFRIDGDGIIATNTDVAGIRSAIEQTGVHIPNERALVIGAGGAARGALAALQDAHLQLTNRTPERADALKQDTADLHIVPWSDRDKAATDATLVVNTTALGMHGGPAPDASPLTACRPDQTVVDLVYLPRSTPLLQRAEAAGARVVDGLAVLIGQGAASFRWWTGRDASVDAMRSAALAAERIALPDRVRRIGNQGGAQ